jgi:hypothetical protein
MRVSTTHLSAPKIANISLGCRKQDSVRLASLHLNPFPPPSATSLTLETRYPKHVWSPAGGWYAQPGNWRQNTLVLGAAVFGMTCIIWKISAEKEQFVHKPEPGRWYPSRMCANIPSLSLPGSKRTLTLWGCLADDAVVTQVEPSTQELGRRGPEGRAGCGGEQDGVRTPWGSGDLVGRLYATDGVE